MKDIINILVLSGILNVALFDNFTLNLPYLFVFNKKSYISILSVFITSWYSIRSFLSYISIYILYIIICIIIVFITFYLYY